MAYFVVWPHPTLSQPVVAGPFMTRAHAKDAAAHVVQGDPATLVLEAASLEQARERARARLRRGSRAVTDRSAGVEAVAS